MVLVYKITQVVREHFLHKGLVFILWDLTYLGPRSLLKYLHSDNKDLKCGSSSFEDNLCRLYNHTYSSLCVLLYKYNKLQN